MSGVVNPRGHLGREALGADVEQLDAAHSDVVEIVEQWTDRGFGTELQRVVETGRGRAGEAEDSVAVVVLDRGPAGDLAVAAAHGQDRELAVKANETLEDARHLAETGPGCLDLVGSAEHGLALAVVAAAACLQHGGPAPPLDRPV